MTNTQDAPAPKNPVAEQQDALDALTNNLIRVVGKPSQPAWVARVTELGKNSGGQLTYDGDKVDDATSLLTNEQKAPIKQALSSMKPIRSQENYTEENQRRNPLDRKPDGSSQAL